MIRPAFIDETEWIRFDDGEKARWANFCRDAEWLLDKPEFRRFAHILLNDPRFFGVEFSPIRATPELTYHAIGIHDAGRAFRLVLQSVSPKRWMQLMHDAFNATKEINPNG